eukprot:TRINITY_DN12350_c0_g1_i1.p1 TRINITY_DN12350_c0_g1~~TRINITY_DN12350_c0_g1_i1.p1  ORF type:complete len:403 (-),score=54.03 TRINITY_DN12350_c0_g1_i1:13-1221(-)
MKTKIPNTTTTMSPPSLFLLSFLLLISLCHTEIPLKSKWDITALNLTKPAVLESSISTKYNRILIPIRHSDNEKRMTRLYSISMDPLGEVIDEISLNELIPQIPPQKLSVYNAVVNDTHVFVGFIDNSAHCVDVSRLMHKLAVFSIEGLVLERIVDVGCSQDYKIDYFVNKGADKLVYLNDYETALSAFDLKTMMPDKVLPYYESVLSEYGIYSVFPWVSHPVEPLVYFLVKPNTGKFKEINLVFSVNVSDWTLSDPVVLPYTIDTNFYNAVMEISQEAPYLLSLVAEQYEGDHYCMNASLFSTNPLRSEHGSDFSIKKYMTTEKSAVTTSCSVGSNIYVVAVDNCAEGTLLKIDAKSFGNLGSVETYPLQKGNSPSIRCFKFFGENAFVLLNEGIELYIDQ